MAKKQKVNQGALLLATALEAEGATGHFADVVRSIYQQESGSGENTTTSNQGAVGGAQIIPSTFASVADKDWNINDPLQNLRAGIRYAKQGYDKSGGDPALTGAFYYGGPGGMEKAKQGIAVYDLKNPNAPSTLQYGQQIASRVGKTVPTGVPNVGAIEPAAYVDNLFNGASARAPVAQPAPFTLDDRMVHPTTESAVDATATFAKAQTAMAAEETTRQNQQTFGMGRDTEFGAAYSNNMQGLFSWAQGLETPSRSKPDQTWMQSYHDDPLPKLAGYNSEEQSSLLDAVNQEDYDNRVFRIGETRDNNKVLNRMSTAGQLGVGVLAGAADPVTWVAGLGAAKLLGAAGVGAVHLARAGRPLAAAASSAGENVLGNLGYTAVQQAVFGEHKSINDYALDAAVGLVPSILTSPLAYRAGRQAILNNTMRETAERNLSTLNQAIQNVGENAPQEVLAAEVRRLEAATIMDTRTALTSGPNEVDKLHIPNLDELPATKEGAPEVSTDIAPSAREGVVQNAAPERFEAYLTKVDKDLSVAKLSEQAPGVHLAPSVADDFVFQQARGVVQRLVDEFLPGQSITLARTVEAVAPSGRTVMPDGSHLQVTGKAAVLTLNPGEHMMSTLVHEVGHAIEKVHLAAATPDIQAGVKAAFADWLTAYKTPKKATAALLQRGPLSRLATVTGTEDIVTSLRDAMAFKSGDAYADVYYSKFAEFMAEQFNKYIQAGAQGVGTGADLALPKQIVNYALSMMKKFVALFVKAQDEGLLRADPRIEAFIDGVRKSVEREATVGVAPDFAFNQGPARPSGAALGPQPSRGNPADLAIAQKYGLDLMPQSTPRERAEYATVVSAIKQAEAWDAANPTDPARLKMLGNNKLFSTATPATVLASSGHPLARMVAGTVLEQTTGAAGRRQTAAISAEMLKTGYVGDAVTHYDTAYKLWSKEIGGSLAEETFKGENRARFNRLVMTERESRQRGIQTNATAQVRKAADVMDAAFERARLDQVKTKTIGWARLPDSAVGYTPHRLAAGKLRDMTSAQLRVFTDVLTEQFKVLEGMDEPFAIELARTYLDHARVRANGGHDIPANIHDPAAADMVRGALEATGLGKDEVAAAMGRYAAGGPAHTKQRLHLDLTAKYPDGAGGTIQLMDLFETDQLGLLRNYARRVSGEVALAQHGIMGSQGLKIIRRALEFGTPGQKPSVAELQAFDQVAAEMLGLPFGNQLGKVGDRVLTANALAKLGGMVYPQVGETINMIWGVGLGNTLKFIGSVPRLWSEVRTLSKGGNVKNSVLGSVEQFGGGGEFGLEGYKMVTAYDSVDNAFQTYTHDSVTWFDRVLRSGADVQKMLSMHRMTQAIQVRGVAEQIIHKAVKYIRDGVESKALADMGFTPEVQAAIRADLPNMVVYDSLGRIKEFDITKAKDVGAATAFTQAVHRGAGQMIQRSYIGENGKWVHDGYLRILTQFKNYPLVAMEKQWARNKSNYGVAGAFGILLGSAAAVMPIYYARIAMNAMGRPDKDEYLEKMLAPEMVARASLNYIGSAGMAGEFTDLLTGATGIGAPAGGRTGANKSFVATAIPAAGFVDDVAKAAKEPITAMMDPNHDYDPLTLAKTLPLNRTPGFIPLINAMRGD